MTFPYVCVCIVLTFRIITVFRIYIFKSNQQGIREGGSKQPKMEHRQEQWTQLYYKRITSQHQGRRDTRLSNLRQELWTLRLKKKNVGCCTLNRFVFHRGVS